MYDEKTMKTQNKKKMVIFERGLTSTLFSKSAIAFLIIRNSREVESL